MKAKIGKLRKKEEKIFYLFMTPWILVFLALTVIPLITGFLVSLTNYDGISLSVKFLGLKNYIRFFRSGDLMRSIIRTIIFAFSNSIVCVVISFFLALIMNESFRGRSICRSIIFLPYVIPVVPAVFIWRNILNRETGLLNILLNYIFPNVSINWVVDFPTITLIVLFVWACGGGMVVILAGLQNIPVELLDSARIDGANKFTITMRLIIPLVSPVIFYQFIILMIGCFQVLIQPILIAVSDTSCLLEQYPPSKNVFTIVLAWIEIFSNRRFGYGTAILWILFLVILLLTSVLFSISKKLVYYEYEKK